MDVVFTWVDDSWPGYLDCRNSHARMRQDINPNRTRDNLDLLKYAIRSVEANVPSLRRIYLLSMRPQIPIWLDSSHPDVVVVHHDEIIPSHYLPTFNSFSIVSHLHLLPGIGPEFLYFEDDMLLGAQVPALGAAAVLQSGREFRRIRAPDPVKESPWNMALHNTLALLDGAHGPQAWPKTSHVPLRIDRAQFAETMDLYAPAVEATRMARFRSAGCIVPEVLFPLHALSMGWMHIAQIWRPGLYGYASLNNFFPSTLVQLAIAGRSTSGVLCLNDDFRNRPNKRVEAYVRRWLEQRWPYPSCFEHTTASS